VKTVPPAAFATIGHCRSPVDWEGEAPPAPREVELKSIGKRAGLLGPRWKKRLWQERAEGWGRAAGGGGLQEDSGTAAQASVDAAEHLPYGYVLRHVPDTLGAASQSHSF
jgi:hypothetical protein